MPRIESLVFGNKRINRLWTTAPLALISALILGTSCGSKQLNTPTPQPHADQSLEYVSDTYGGVPPVLSLNPLEEQIILELPDSPPSLTLDNRLVLAARKHASKLAGTSNKTRTTEEEHLLFALQIAGVYDYITTFISITTKNGDLEGLKNFFHNNSRDWTHFGLGVDESGEAKTVVLIGTRRAVELSPIPVSPRLGKNLEIHGRVLQKGAITSDAFLGLPDGSVKKLAVSCISGTKEFRIEAEINEPGRYEFEIQIETEAGPETVVLLPLFPGVERDARPVVFPQEQPYRSSPEEEGLIAAMINSAREKSGLAPLEYDRRLAGAAKEHSRDMVERQYFGHRSPNGNYLKDRLSSRGLNPSHSAENLARSSDPVRAHRNLARSPSHRLNIMSPVFTHLGLAVERDGDSVVLTEIYVKW